MRTKPSDYADTLPCCSIFGKTECEVIAQAAMGIMGDKWRPITADEFLQSPIGRKTAYAHETFRDMIERVLAKVTCEADAVAFSTWWKRIHNEAPACDE